MKDKLVSALITTKKNIFQSIPLIIGTLLLIALINSLFNLNFLVDVLHFNILINSVIGAFAGSLAAGSPITSYILGGELNANGINLATITAFILAWVTVGIIQLPAEMIALGKKFSLIRNLLSFISAVLIGLIVHLFLS